jgi:hypothetical protein
MDQRGPMPPGMRAFVTFMAIMFCSVLVLSILQGLGVIAGRTFMGGFYATGAVAGLAAWLQLRRAPPKSL